MHITVQNLALGTLDFFHVCSRMQKKEIRAMFARQVFKSQQTAGELVL